MAIPASWGGEGAEAKQSKALGSIWARNPWKNRATANSNGEQSM